MTKTMTVESLTEGAKNIIRSDRNKEYGSFEMMMIRTAEVWSGILNRPVTAQQVSLCMAGLKLVRAAQTPGHEDSYVDAIGYMSMAGEIIGDVAGVAPLKSNE